MTTGVWPNELLDEGHSLIVMVIGIGTMYMMTTVWEMCLGDVMNLRLYQVSVTWRGEKTHKTKPKGKNRSARSRIYQPTPIPSGITTSSPTPFTFPSSSPSPTHPPHPPLLPQPVAPSPTQKHDPLPRLRPGPAHPRRHQPTSPPPPRLHPRQRDTRPVHGASRTAGP